MRMGLSYVKGLHEVDIDRVLEARPYTGLGDFTRRVRLRDGALELLAQAGAMDGLRRASGPGRRDALWQVLGAEPRRAGSLDLSPGEDAAGFERLSDLETIRWDYDFTGHSPRGHPLATLRSALRAQGLPDAAGIRAMPDGRRVRYAGLAISRQRPGTANGVVFMTLEDEAGFVNLVLWEKVFEEFQVLAKTASFLGVTGEVQSRSGVVHVVAERLWVPRMDARLHEVKSRAFH